MSLSALVLALGMPLSGAAWWTSEPPPTARDYWLDAAAGRPAAARSDLAALLTARESDPAGEAAVVWSLLRGSARFREPLGAVLAAPGRDELMELLGDPAAGAVDLLRAVAGGEDGAARSAALEALGRAGPRERELLLAVLLDPRDGAAVRAAAGRGLLVGPPLSPAAMAKIAAAFDLPKPEAIQIAFLHLAGRRPDPGLVHRLALLARSRRSADFQAAALTAFVTACRYAHRDEIVLAEALRGFDEIAAAATARDVVTPGEEAALLLARRWLAPPLFEKDIHTRARDPVSWRRYFADPHATSFWLDAVFEHGREFHGRDQVGVVDEILALLEAEAQDSPAHPSEVLIVLTERRPSWIVDRMLRTLESSDADVRRRGAEGLVAVPDPHAGWESWKVAAVAWSRAWDHRVAPDVLHSLLVRALRRRAEAKRLVAGSLRALRDRPELEELLLDADFVRLRSAVIESVLRGDRPAALWNVVAIGTPEQRLRALESLVAGRDADAAIELAVLEPARVLESVFGGPLNREVQANAALAELGIRWLDADPEPPIAAWQDLFGHHDDSSESWLHLWDRLNTTEARRDETRTVVITKLRAICDAPAAPDIQSAWEILAASSHYGLAQAAQRRLDR